ncbi:MAG: hypothetical protein ABJA85_02860 [Bacteroidota bacterium]
MAVGLSGRIIYSTNGTTWTSAEVGSSYAYYGVSFVNNLFVAVGGNATVGSLAKVKSSADGATWTDVSTSISGHFHSLTYGAGKYVLVGRDNGYSATTMQKFMVVTTSDITNSAVFSTPVSITSSDGDIGVAQFVSVAFGNNSFVAISNLKVAPLHLLNPLQELIITV